MPRGSRISNRGIQYTPVDSSATVVTPHGSSPSVKRSRSSGKVANTRTGFSSRPGGTATNISRAPTSTPAAFGSHTGRSSKPMGLRQRLTTALRTKLGATLLFGVRKPTTDTTAYFHCLSLHLRMQKWGGQDKFLSALPRPPAGPYAVEKLLREKLAIMKLCEDAPQTTFPIL
jgi:hypothetical protein